LIDKEPLLVHAGQAVARRDLDDALTLTEEHRIRHQQERSWSPLSHLLERVRQLVRSADID